MAGVEGWEVVGPAFVRCPTARRRPAGSCGRGQARGGTRTCVDSGGGFGGGIPLDRSPGAGGRNSGVLRPVMSYCLTDPPPFSPASPTCRPVMSSRRSCTHGPGHPLSEGRRLRWPSVVWSTRRRWPSVRVDRLLGPQCFRPPSRVVESLARRCRLDPRPGGLDWQGSGATGAWPCVEGGIPPCHSQSREFPCASPLQQQRQRSSNPRGREPQPNRAMVRWPQALGVRSRRVEAGRGPAGTRPTGCRRCPRSGG